MAAQPKNSYFQLRKSQLGTEVIERPMGLNNALILFTQRMMEDAWPHLELHRWDDEAQIWVALLAYDKNQLKLEKLG